MLTPISRVALAAILAMAVSATTEAASSEPTGQAGHDAHTMAPLTDQPGDAANGRKIVQSKGLCLSCHALPIPEAPDHGDIGPDLTHVGARMEAAELRTRIVDPKIINPDTPMPSFLKKDLYRVAKKFQGQTILTAQEVEDVVAYLQTLK